MPANAALSVTTAIQAATPRATPVDARGSDSAGRFDSHLDAARQQHEAQSNAQPDPAERPDRPARASRDKATGTAADKSEAADTKATDANGTSVPTDAATAKAVTDAGTDAVAADPSTTADKSDSAIDADTLTVAGAMLALLGQAMPASASAATGGAAKVMAATSLKQSISPAGGLSPATDASADALGGASGQVATATVGVSVDAAAQSTKAMAEGLSGGQGFKLAQQDTDAGKLQDLGALLAPAPQSTAPAPVAAIHALSIASPAGSAAFAQELGQQVAWLGNQDVKQARIRLHPEDLGQVDVKVSVQQHTGQVDVTFAAQHPAAVHALQQTLPQLDALLAQHGLSLGQANVGQQSSGSDGRSGGGFGGHGGDSADSVESVAERPVSVAAIGLLDAFA